MFLNSERERYKNLLDVEYSKVACNLRDSIKKFNQKLHNSVEHKTYIDSGINQENLQINRQIVQQSQRLNLLQKEQTIK